MEKIKRFFECYIPVTACNFKCDYCYIRQENRVLGQMPEWPYSPEYIGKALSKERLGGTCYFSLCAGGETLLHQNMPVLIHNLLQQGHYVNVTTNGTITKAFDKILTPSPPHSQKNLKRLHFAFSLHYLELKRKNMLDRFVENVHKVKGAGCSFVIQMNLYDGYEPYLEEIKAFCLTNFGALPQLAVTRREEKTISYLTSHTNQEYVELGNQFNSPLWEFTNRNFMVKRREFCYAGDWASCLDITGGWWKKCYGSRKSINIYEDITKPIPFEAVGRYCPGHYCVNSSHFMSLGCIPQLATDVTYAGLRNRLEAHWYNEEAAAFLGGKLKENNEQYPWYRRALVDIKEPTINITIRIQRIIRRRILKK